MSISVWVDYTNWRGERLWRKITPVPGGINFTSSPWHDKQWLLKAVDEEDPNQQVKEFALLGIHAFAAEKPTDGQTMDVTRLSDQEIDTFQKQLYDERIRRHEEAEKARVAERVRRNRAIHACAATLLDIFRPEHDCGLIDADDYGLHHDRCLRCLLLSAAANDHFTYAREIDFALNVTRS